MAHQRNAAAVQARQAFLSKEIDGHQFCQRLEDLGWHPAAVTVAMDDIQAQQRLDSEDPAE
jgi:hypothetical protein